MRPDFPAPPLTLSLPSEPPRPSGQPPSPKDWPHAPVHRLADATVYIVTAATLHKRHLFHTASQRDLLERLILSFAKQHGWQLEAWCVLANHYHFVARGNPASTNLGQFIHQLHGVSARSLNAMEAVVGRAVWHNFWDTKLTHQHSYLARLHYVHQNAVKHGLVRVANLYPWCSATWFERVASPAQVKAIYSLKTDRVNVYDEY